MNTRQRYQFKDYEGKKINNLTPLKEWYDIQNKRRWECKCVCGKIVSPIPAQLCTNQSKSCGCLNDKVTKEHKDWKGYGDISGSHFSEILRHSKGRKLEFKVTIQEIWQLFLKQERKCALSGLEIAFSKGRKSKRTASLDRIDNSKGYVKNNIQWLHKDVNKMKNTHNQDYFVNLCKRVAEGN